MAYVALYRKWRPSNFANLVGQEHISRTLSNAITQGKIAHAYMFSGPRGTGKTSTAKILAKALNCVNGPTPMPCNICANCKKINDGTSMDVFEIDAASNRGIDEIRDLRETVKFTPVDGRYKVYIIDEVHMLTTEAFNALLKTLEEPPAHVVFILATTEAHKVPATIHSRCQRYDFKRISVEAIAGRLTQVAQEMHIDAQPEALRLIAVQADGGLRDALSILDQCSALENSKITAELVRKIIGLIGYESICGLVDCIAKHDSKSILQALSDILAAGQDVKQVLTAIASHMRNVLIYQAAGSLNSIGLDGERDLVLEKHSKAFSHEAIVKIIRQMHEALNEAKWSPQPRITGEIALLELCNTVSAVDNALDSAAIQRITELENKVKKLLRDRNSQPAAAGNRSWQESPKVITELPADAAPRQPINSKAAAISPPAADSPAAVLNGSDNGAKVWDDLLKMLLAKGKRSVYACVVQGSLRSFDDNQLLIAFSAAFPKERTEKHDYREMLETFLQEICGHTVALRCTLDAAAPAKRIAKQEPSKPKRPDISDITPAAKQNIDTAVKIFGDNFIAPESPKE